MITAWDIYLLTRLDGVLTALAVLLLISASILGGWALTEMLECSFDEIKKPFIKYLTIWLCVFFFGMLIPNSKEIAAMYLLPKVVNNEEVQKPPTNALKLLNGKMEQWIDSQLKIKKEEK